MSEQNFKFVHLSCHSSFSLLEGVPSIKGLAAKSAELGMPAIAVTDTNNLFGAVEMGKYVPSQGVQPIIGMQLGITLNENDPLQQDLPKAGLITVLVQNETGWRNLTKIASKASLEVPEGAETQVILSAFKGMSEGLICMTASAREGALGYKLIHEGKEAGATFLQDLKEYFPDRLYVEIQRHGMEEEAETEEALLDLAYELNIPLVATNDCRFLEKDQSVAFEVMLAIGDGMTISNSNRRLFTDQHYFKSAGEMCALFSDLPEATANTVKIAQRCGYIVPTGINFMPAWLIDPEGPDAGKEVDDIMISDSEIGLKKRMDIFVFTDEMSDEKRAEVTKEYEDRLKFELDVIIGMGYAGYFLITSDFIKWSKENDIPVGPGRGSGAGSLVAWAMEITDIDPIRFDLYFERFLNPERVSLPDFDIDFCQDRRGEVIDYVRRKYGDDCVSQIITFGTLKAKACIRDVGRVLDMPFNQVGRIASYIPEGPASIPLAQAMKEDAEVEGKTLKQVYNDDADVKNLLDICMQLEGAYRHASTHAAGVMIADRRIDDICPLYKDDRSPMPATQFSMFDAEASGLVKFDFLGLKTLTVIQYAMIMLKEIGVDFDIALIPIDDTKTFDLLKKGHTIGVFQVESRGMTDFLVKMEPDKFQYLSDVIALYRPGPLGSGMADDFVECRHGRQKPKYPHPALEEVLEETFGVPVYQEQVMRMAQVMAGYTLGGADMLRRAMGKKKPEEMAKHRIIFRDGAAKEHNISAEQSDSIFDLMENFAGYGFNKAHTIAYGWISYQTAYLKANYPVEFMAASMTLDRGNSDKILKFKQELVHMEIDLLLPNINKSHVWFRREGESIRFALTAIKGAGEEAMKAVVDERKENGEFKDIFDLVERIPPTYMNRRNLEVLIKSGALDCLNENRAFLAGAINTLLSHMHTFHSEKNSNQIGLFGEAGDSNALSRPELKECNKWDPFEKLENEQKVIGFYLSAHPLQVYGDELCKIAELKDIAALQNIAMAGTEKVRIACIINAKREVKTKRGDRMAILTISDSTGQDEIAVFPEGYRQYETLMEKNKPLFMSLQLSYDEERVRINVESISDLEKSLKQQNCLSVKLKALSALSDLKSLIEKQEAGNTKCEISYFVEGLGDVQLCLPQGISLTRRTKLQIEALSQVEVL